MTDTATINLPSATAADEILCNKTSEGINDVVRLPFAAAAERIVSLSGPWSSEAEFLAAEVPALLQFVETTGYYEDGDLGGHRKVRISTPDPVEAWHAQSADGAWWQIAEPVLRPQMFGVRAVPAGTAIATVTSSYDCTTAFNNTGEAALALDASVEIPPGFYAHTDTLEWLEGPRYVGLTAGANYRAARPLNSSSLADKIFTEFSGAVFIAIGTFSKDYTQDWITKEEQNGYNHEIPGGEQDYGNSLDAEIPLLDLTNQDAVGATKATLKPFSVGHHFKGTSRKKFHIEGVTFTVNCPDPTTESGGFGLGGYAIQDTIVPWDDVDIGVYCESPWRGYFNFDVVGYPDMRGLLVTPYINGEDGAGYAEHNLFERCMIQGGTAVRAGGSWPILSKTGTSVTVRWTASHRFDTSGTLRIGDTVYNADEYEYSGLTFNSGTPDTLTFTGIADTSGITDGNGGDHIFDTTSGGGFAQTKFSMCEFYDFSHSSLVDCVSDEYGSKARPYQAALEISGQPMRAINVDRCIIHPAGPAALLIGYAYNLVFEHNWMEARNRLDEEGDTSYGRRGAAAFCGPNADMLDEAGATARGDIIMDGRSIWSGINCHPLRDPSSSYRMGTLEDIWNPSGCIDKWENFRSNDRRSLSFWSSMGQELDLRVRRDDNSLARVIRGMPDDGTVHVGDRGDGEGFFELPGPDSSAYIQIKRSFRPDAPASLDIGSPSYPFDDIHADNNAIQPSDARLKLIDDIPGAWLDAWERVGVKRYKWLSAVANKGDLARWHIGFVAQEVIAAFAVEGIDEDTLLRDIGIIGLDKWDDEYEPVRVKKPILDREGNVESYEWVETGERKLVLQAGERYSVRPVECLWLEMAVQRRVNRRVEERLAAL